MFKISCEKGCQTPGLEKEKSIDIIYYQDYNVSEYRIVTL